MSRKMKIEWKKKSDKSSRKLSIFQNCLRKGEKYCVTPKNLSCKLSQSFTQQPLLSWYTIGPNIK